MTKLPKSFYLSNDVESIAYSMLGKFLFSSLNGIVTGGIITETEAYKGLVDKASHAYGGKRTKRTEVMYRQGGITYIYLCYGVHYLLNVVTSEIDIPHAVLIRGIYPITGVNHMMDRTRKVKAGYNLTNGPGKLTKALGIDISLNGVGYMYDKLWIEDKGIIVREQDIVKGPRIGVDYAGEDALLPYRYVLAFENYINGIKKTP